MDIDVTILIELGLFLFCLVSLNGMILKPFLKVIEDREAKIEGAQEEVELLTRLGGEAMEKYQARMREAQLKAQRQQESLKSEGREEERRLLAEVRADIADKLNKARQEVVQAEQNARQELSGDTDQLARQLVSKIIGREVAA